ncbi:hypothetical protein [Altericroceibacterium xinjiangense]|uniref:hypothetical protein n=1 Tax=Altericroceibacterium xinjiangense TaxID=762261 RepID=UPI000F7F3097|nr:hypothetical protein [Altericroceibacterium xinjiangense]
MAEDFPRTLTHDELRFEVELILKRVPRLLIRDWGSTNQRTSDLSRDILRDMILERLKRYQVRAPARVRIPFGNAGTSYGEGHKS